MNRKSRLQSWAGVMGGGLAGLVLVGSLWAADKPRRSPWPFQRAETAERTSDNFLNSTPPEEPVVRLNYSNRPWETVLQNVAKQSGCTITLQNTPPGTFSRLDARKYTRSEAVRILNHELEPRGFRILTKDDHLTVLDLHQARSTYRRPVSVESSTSRNGVQVPSADELTLSRQRRAQLQQRFETITREIHDQKTIVQTSGEADEGNQVVTGDHETARSLSPADTAVVETVYKSQNRTAVDLAQMIYRSFKSRSKLLDSGNNGLPAFRVYRSAPEEGVGADNLFGGDRSAANIWFTMEIDTEGDRLIVAAPKHTSVGLKNLIQRLDTPPTESAPATRLVEGTQATLHVAQQLQPQLGRLQEARRRLGQASSQQPMQLAWQNDGAQPPQGGQPGQAGQPGQEDQPGQIQQQIPSALSGLRGEVTIEALNDLNLLILRGNEEDLKQVQEVINMIEQLAEGTRPDIHLMFLNNVNSEALADLLNDVYERLGNLRNVGAEQGSQTVDVVPIATPNAILILAPKNAIEAVKLLATELDQPGDPLSEVEIFRLRSAVASQVVEVLTDFYEERVGLGARIQATADVRTNTVIVHARPSELAEVRLIIRRMDGKPRASNQIRVIPLQQAAADELAEFLTTTIQGILNPPVQQAGAGGFGGANQAAQELRDTKSVVLEFLKRDGNAQQLIRSGLLTDVRITGDLRTNSLTVIAPEQTMTLLVELISILDQPAAAIADIKVFQLKNADATAAVDLLNELFATDDEDQLGIAISGATDTSSTLVPLSFSVDPRTNTVVAIGGLDALTVVEAILTRLDESELRERETTVLRLRNSLAADVAAAINEFVQNHLSLIQIDPERVSTSEIIDQTYIVVPEPATNTLLISASPRYFEDILRLAKELDFAPSQVFISSMIVRVDLLDTDEWGVELGFQDPILFDRSISPTDMMGIATGGVMPGFLFNNQQLGTAPVDPGIVGSQGLSNFSLGRTNTDLGFGGLVLSASSDSVSVLLRALKARRNIRVLSAPKVHALDNQLARIQDGQLVPLVNGVSANGFTTTPNIVYQETGLILEVTPRVTPEGQVVMGVSAQNSALSGATVPVFFDVTSGNTISSPIINQTIAATSLMVNDGQTVVLGGIILDTDTVNERKVPYLGDLPYIGHAFRFDSNVHMRSELLIFLTPHVIRNDADEELVKQVETERINFFEHEAEAIFGPLFSVPPPQVLQDGYGVLQENVTPTEDGSMLPAYSLPPTWELNSAPSTEEKPFDQTLP